MSAGHEKTGAAVPRQVPRPADTIAALLRHSAHAMLVVEGDGRIVDANARAEPLLNSPTADLLGTHLPGYFTPTDRTRLAKRLEQAALAAEAVEDLDGHLARPEDGLVAVSFLAVEGTQPALVLVQLRDLTLERTQRDTDREVEAQAFREQLARDRKMIDLGGLISGVAHELRTPLTYVSNTLALERRALEDLARTLPLAEPRVREVLDINAMAVQGLDRVNRLLHELRPLTKNKPHRTVRMDLAELAMDAVRTFRGSHAGSTRIELDLRSTHTVPLDKDDMANVVLNLLVNAAQAMGDKGVIKVETRNADSPPTIRVIDQGPGVPDALKSRVGEPFFTTKADGTGLGLFISRRTVEAHGGTLWVEDTPGGGATFVVRLPERP